MPLPPIHERVKRSKLVAGYDLESVSMKICAKLGARYVSESDDDVYPATSVQVDSLVPVQNEESDEESDTFFELSIPLEQKVSIPDEKPSVASFNPPHNLDLAEPEVVANFEELFLRKLVKRSYINKWQASKLQEGRSTFFLGNAPSRYRVIGQLGKGGYGEVYHGREEQYTSNKTGKIRNDVAIKVLQNKNATPESRYMFLREHEIARRFRSPNIVAFRGISNSSSIDYCVLEYIDGGDASRLLKKYGRLDYRVACYIVSESAKGLAYLHDKGVIHRDIKPSNILLMKSGEVKLTDFGFVTAIRDYQHTGKLSPIGVELEEWEENAWERDVAGTGLPRERRRRIQGTRNFIAPEQYERPDCPDPLWDVYSLGCALYSLLTGSPPPEPDSFSESLRRAKSRAEENYMELGIEAQTLVIPELSDLPRGLSRLIMKMMARDPSERIQSAQEVVKELAQWTSSEQQTLFDKIKLGLTNDRENVWSEENIRQCFNIPKTVPLNRSPVVYSPGFQSRTGIGGASMVSASTAFYEAVLGPEQPEKTLNNVLDSVAPTVANSAVANSGNPTKTVKKASERPVSNNAVIPPVLTSRLNEIDQEPSVPEETTIRLTQIRRTESIVRFIRRFLFYPLAIVLVLLLIAVALKS